MSNHITNNLKIMKKIIKIYSKIKLQHNLDMNDFIEFLIIYFQGQIDQIIEAVTNVKSSFYTWFFLWIFIRIYRKLNKF